MIPPETPDDEKNRIETLRALRILDSEQEERFDRLTRMAKRMFNVPIALVSLVDSERQWFKSKQGELGVDETPRAISFCGHAILSDEVFMVPNTLDDERFADNPLVTDKPNVRFYAGYPLKVANGSRLGTLCLIDHKPRTLGPEDIQLLQDLGAMAEQEISAIQLATLDELTMISNRRGFIMLSQHSLQLAKRKGMPVTILLFDLDDFKPINDQFGHAEGDRALIAFANTLREVLRESDIFARIGGDEFVVLLTDTNEEEVKQVIARIDMKLDEYNKQEHGYHLKYSVGVDTYLPEELVPVDEMLVDADERMYDDKNDSKE